MLLCYVVFVEGALFCYDDVLFWMLWDALCSVFLCSVLSCSVMMCCVMMLVGRVRRGREAGYSGILGDSRGFSGTLGTTGGLAAAVCTVGVAGRSVLEI